MAWASTTGCGRVSVFLGSLRQSCDWRMSLSESIWSASNKVLQPAAAGATMRRRG